MEELLNAVLVMFYLLALAKNIAIPIEFELLQLLLNDVGATRHTARRIDIINSK
jgi:hypothetical protein